MELEERLATKAFECKMTLSIDLAFKNEVEQIIQDNKAFVCSVEQDRIKVTISVESKEEMDKLTKELYLVRKFIESEVKIMNIEELSELAGVVNL